MADLTDKHTKHKADCELHIATIAAHEKNIADLQAKHIAQQRDHEAAVNQITADFGAKLTDEKSAHQTTAESSGKRIADLEQQLRDALALVDQWRSEATGAGGANAQLEAALNSEKERRKKAEDEVKELTDSMAQQKAHCESEKQGLRDDANQRVADAESQAEQKLQAALKAAADEKARIQAAIAFAQEQLDKSNAESKKADDDATKKIAELEKLLHESQLNTSKANAEKSDLAAKLAKAETDLQGQIAELKAQLLESEKRNGATGEENARVLAGKDGEIRALQAKLASLEKQLADTKAELQATIDDLTNQLNAALKKIKELEDAHRNCGQEISIGKLREEELARQFAALQAEHEKDRKESEAALSSARRAADDLAAELAGDWEAKFAESEKRRAEAEKQASDQKARDAALLAGERKLGAERELLIQDLQLQLDAAGAQSAEDSIAAQKEIANLQERLDEALQRISDLEANLGDAGDEAERLRRQHDEERRELEASLKAQALADKAAADAKLRELEEQSRLAREQLEADLALQREAQEEAEWQMAEAARLHDEKMRQAAERARLEMATAAADAKEYEAAMASLASDGDDLRVGFFGVYDGILTPVYFQPYREEISDWANELLGTHLEQSTLIRDLCTPELTSQPYYTDESPQ